MADQSTSLRGDWPIQSKYKSMTVKPDRRLPWRPSPQVLEDRTRASRQEMDNLETLQDLKELNTRNARLSHAQLIQLHGAYTENLTRLQADEDEAFVEWVMWRRSRRNEAAAGISLVFTIVKISVNGSRDRLFVEWVTWRRSSQSVAAEICLVFARVKILMVHVLVVRVQNVPKFVWFMFEIVLSKFACSD